MYLAQVCRYDILYTVNQLARAMSKPSKAHMGAAKHLLRYLAGSTDSRSPTSKEVSNSRPFPTRTGEKLPTKGKSTSSYIIMLSNGPISFKVGIQELTAQPTMEAELVAAAFTMKEAVFFTAI